MASNSTLKHKAVNGVLWRIGEQGGNQIIQLALSIILARLIAPEQFGMIAMLSVFTAIANVFINSGLSNALIRKNDRTQIDCSTVYWYNIAMSIGCYALLFFTSPLIAAFYEMPELCAVLRVSSLGIVISSLVGVHYTILTIEMNFKALTKYNLLGLIISGAVGVTLAYCNFKVWALVYQGLAGSIFGALCLWRKVRWRPTFEFSKKSFHEFFGFGSKMLASSLLDTIYSNIYSVVIGKVYKASDLAFYSRGTTITQMTSSMPTSVLQSVTYPTLCKLQDDDAALTNGYRRTLKLAAFVIFPLCLGVGAVAFPLINVMYTQTWIYAATLLSILAFGKMWYPIHAINLNYLIVKGRSDLFFRLEVIKKIQGVLVLVLTIPLGLEAMCWGSVFSSILSLIWNTHYNGKFLKMGIMSQLKDLFPTLALSAVMFAGARATAHFLGNGVDSLICSVATGAIIYIGGALLFKFPEVAELKNLRK